jgi:hypothetical protein
MSAPVQTIERDGFTVKVYHIDDHIGDTSYLGACVAEPTKYPAWDRAKRRVLWHHRDWSHHKDAAPDWDRREYRYVHDFQDTAGVTRREAEKYIRQNVARLESYGDAWTFVGIVAKAYRADIKLGEDAIWGVESDSGLYLAQLGEEMARGALLAAREALDRLCGAAK